MSGRLDPNGGFTLVETLVSLGIFGLVAALGFGAINLAVGQQERLSRGAALEMAAAACLERMARDLSGVYVPQPPAFSPPAGDGAVPEFRVLGEPDRDGEGFDRLEFASGSHVSFQQPPRAGISRIAYYAEAAGENGYVLRRSDRLLPLAQPEELPAEGEPADPVLCEHLSSVAFTFYDGDGEPRDRWDSESAQQAYASPAAVGIALEVDIDGQARRFETTVVLPVRRGALEAAPP